VSNLPKKILNAYVTSDTLSMNAKFGQTTFYEYECMILYLMKHKLYLEDDTRATADDLECEFRSSWRKV
jgi:hypothetical protein